MQLCVTAKLEKTCVSVNFIVITPSCVCVYMQLCVTAKLEKTYRKDTHLYTSVGSQLTHMGEKDSFVTCDNS